MKLTRRLFDFDSLNRIYERLKGKRKSTQVWLAAIRRSEACKDEAAVIEEMWLELARTVIQTLGQEREAAGEYEQRVFNFVITDEETGERKQYYEVLAEANPQELAYLVRTENRKAVRQIRKTHRIHEYSIEARGREYTALLNFELVPLPEWAAEELEAPG
ncbi:unnamed protein product [uncultured bacterium]|nr:unnamed protein product [uncultured bacterium]